MEGTAVAVCEKLRENLNRGSTILKYLIIHWRCETARISKGALLEGELVISIEALNSKHQANTLHCVTTIASAGSIFGGLVLKKFLKGLPLILPNPEQPTSTIFKDTSYFINWKKYHLCMVPNLDFNLDRDLVLPDVSYQVESSEGDQTQNMDPQGQTLLLFLFVDFHSGFAVQKMELWGVHTLLTTHLSAILTESHSVVQDSIQVAVDQALEQHHQAVKAHQKLQASLSVAVNSIMSIMTGSTSSSFRKTCLQTLQAADTQEFGTKLHKSFHEITQNRFLHHCSREVKQLLPEKNNAEQSTEDAHENSSLELLAGTSGQVENKSLKRGSLCQGLEETRAFRSPRALNPSEAALGRAEPTAAPLTPSRNRTGPRSGLEDALWLQEISNLSEWLSPGSAS
ncbi:type 2 DNA topoisomerase 6 subunit B-like isoform 2-T2 [Megaptera novaeangliae]